MTASPPIQLRGATEEDHGFCREVGHAGIRPYAERSGGWDQTQADLDFRADWNAKMVSSIEHEGHRVGYVQVVRDGASTVLEGIYVQMPFRSQGIGSDVLRRVIAGAVPPVRLRVFRVNPAQRPYARLGFVTVSETATHYVMEHSGRPSPNPG